ncbi:MAG: hypothetical protein ABI416_06125 [Ginsengibacter sp.]
MESLKFNVSGELEIEASPGSAKSDFDFLKGRWTVKNRKLKTRLNNCNEWIAFDATNEDYSALNGLGNIDHFKTSFDEIPFEGLTIRLFNPSTRLWSIYWADSNSGKLAVPQAGSFEKNIGYFYSKDIFNDKEIIVVFKWDKTDVANPLWSQAFSSDQGKTWEWNWHMNMHSIT